MEYLYLFCDYPYVEEFFSIANILGQSDNMPYRIWNIIAFYLASLLM